MPSDVGTSPDLLKEIRDDDMPSPDIKNLKDTDASGVGAGGSGIATLSPSKSKEFGAASTVTNSSKEQQVKKLS